MSTYFKIIKRLDHFSIDVEHEFKEGVLVIQGESGAGKTTILNCISGLTFPEEGEIILDNELVFSRGYRDREKSSSSIINVPTRKRNVAYLFQNYALFPNMTVEQNVLYGIKNKQEYKNKQKRSELLEYAQSVMETFRILHLKDKSSKNISGGEKQRVALTRAIVTKPKLLLLDEPFSALDMKTKEIVYEEFLTFKRDYRIPTVLITHSPKEADLFADERIHMKEGKLQKLQKGC